ncbi:MAG: hypothetical protein NXH85_07590 [Pseudomonadaceae bacterium]|nr:hypothetical protein [Pseudomonadaceae bacterium]
MNTYHIWCDLKPGESAPEFADAVADYLGEMRRGGAIEGYRLSRRKLGLASAEFGEFHIAIECLDLAQLDKAFEAAAAHREPISSKHAAVYSKVQNVRFGLYRDYPDQL